jgi:hypothetical protein
MPAKFVNLFEFFGLKIFSEPEMEGLVQGGLYPDRVVTGIYRVDIRPDKEPALGNSGDRDPGVVEGQVLFRAPAYFMLAIKQVDICYAQAEVDDRRRPYSPRKLNGADTHEEKDLHQPEKEIYPGKLLQYISADDDQDKDIQGYEQLTPEIQWSGFGLMQMADGMCQDQQSGCDMQPAAGAFQFLKRRMNDGERQGVHAAVI